MFLGHNQVPVLTDHRNLLFVFDPLALRPNAPQYVLSKVHWWAMHLSRFDFCIEQIVGVKNVLAYLHTRWDKRHRQNHATRKNVMALYKTIVTPFWESPWPNVEALLQAQVDIKDSVGQCDEDGLWKRLGRIVIPEDYSILKLRILVAEHCGTVGNRGAGATETRIRN